MKVYNSLTRFDDTVYNGRIITFGLTDQENFVLKTIFKDKNFEIYDAEVASDLVAILTNAIVINAHKLKSDDIELLESYYSEVNKEADERVFWIGLPKPSLELQMLFNCFDTFDDMVFSFKNHQV